MVQAWQLVSPDAQNWLAMNWTGRVASRKSSRYAQEFFNEFSLGLEEPWARKQVTVPARGTSETKSQVIQQLYEFGPYRLDQSERKLLRNHQIVELPPKAFDTLVHMVRNSGHLMEKDELIRTLWPDSFVEEGSLSNNIFLLRKALGEDPQYIEAVPRRGYRFVGAVRCLPDEARGHREEAQFPGSRPAIAAAASPALPFWRRRALGGSRPLCCWL